MNLRLYRQSITGVFEDVTVDAGLDLGWGTGFTDGHHSGLAAGDIDNNGYLDFFVCTWPGRAYMYLNNTDGTFTEVTVSSGTSDQTFAYQQPVMFDFNRDG